MIGMQTPMQTSGVFNDVILSQVQRLLDAFRAGALGPVSHEVHPNLDRSSRGNYLFFTLSASVNFQRKSENLWRSARDTYQDESTRFVFDPVFATADPERTKRALVKHRLALQTNRHADIWLTLSRTFGDSYDGDPRQFVLTAQSDVVKILEELRSNKKLFPYLSGPKLANYWLYMLSRFTDVQLRNKEHISVIPDTHVMRATRHLGLLGDNKDDPVVVADVWTRGLVGTGIVPMDMHAPLWRWSRAGFPVV